MRKSIQFRKSSYAKERSHQFWIRFFAFGIDLQFINLLTISLYWVLQELNISDVYYRHEIISNSKFAGFIFIVVFIMYFTLFEQSKWNGSIGKAFLRLRVLSLDDKKVKFSKSLLRNVLKVPSILSVVGIFIIDVTQHRQSIHDLLTGTKVIRR